MKLDKLYKRSLHSKIYKMLFLILALLIIYVSFDKTIDIDSGKSLRIITLNIVFVIYILCSNISILSERHQFFLMIPLGNKEKTKEQIKSIFKNEIVNIMFYMAIYFTVSFTVTNRLLTTSPTFVFYLMVLSFISLSLMFTFYMTLTKIDCNIYINTTHDKTQGKISLDYFVKMLKPLLLVILECLLIILMSILIKTEKSYHLALFILNIVSSLALVVFSKYKLRRIYKLSPLQEKNGGYLEGGQNDKLEV